MSYIERSDEEITTAIEKWVATHPEPDEIALWISGVEYSPTELLEEIQKKSALGVEMLSGVREVAKRGNTDPLLIIQRSI